MAGPYDDEEPSDDELRSMEEAERNGGLPPPDSSDELPQGDDDDAGDPPAADDGPPKPAKGDAPAEGDDDGQSDEPGDGREELSRFLDKHKGKTPEQLLELAFQQSKRANRAEFDSRKSTENLSQVLARIQQARDARVNELAQKREGFRQKVETDPDAALLEAHEAQLSREEQEELGRLDREEFEARATAAIELASSVIPDFATRAPQIRSFGVEMGFSPEEVDGIVDGRQIVTLHLASIAGRMMQAGIIDPAGRFVSLPEPANERQSEPAPRGTGFNRAPGRAAGAGKTIEQQLAELDSMDDAAFDALSDELVMGLLKQDASR